MARRYSGLSESDTQALFHSLIREGRGLRDPYADELASWRWRQRKLIDFSDLSLNERERAERTLFHSRAEQPSGKLFHAWSQIELRARQEAVLRSITTAVDLARPGSQSAEYELDKSGRPARLWYASYGSNLNQERFLTYITGGKPPGSTSYHLGTTDRTEPQGDIPIRFNGRMHFAYMSSRWGSGGVAFMDLDSAGHALGRAYNISSDQFDEVVAQENGRTPRLATEIDLSVVMKKGRATVLENALYDTVLHIGDYDGAPVFTFTGAFTAQDALREAERVNDEEESDGNWMIASNAPHSNYLRMIASGLGDTFGMTKGQQTDYLRGCGGADTWARRELLARLRDKSPVAIPTKQYTPITKSYWDSDDEYDYHYDGDGYYTGRTKTTKKRPTPIGSGWNPAWGPEPDYSTNTSRKPSTAGSTSSGASSGQLAVPSAASLAAMGVTPAEWAAKNIGTPPTTAVAGVGSVRKGPIPPTTPQPIRPREPLAKNPFETTTKPTVTGAPTTPAAGSSGAGSRSAIARAEQTLAELTRKRNRLEASFASASGMLDKHTGRLAQVRAAAARRRSRDSAPTPTTTPAAGAVPRPVRPVNHSAQPSKPGTPASGLPSGKSHEHAPQPRPASPWNLD